MAIFLSLIGFQIFSMLCDNSSLHLTSKTKKGFSLSIQEIVEPLSGQVGLVSVSHAVEPVSNPELGTNALEGEKSDFKHLIKCFICNYFTVSKFKAIKYCIYNIGKLNL